MKAILVVITSLIFFLLGTFLGGAAVPDMSSSFSNTEMVTPDKPRGLLKVGDLAGIGKVYSYESVNGWCLITPQGVSCL